MSSVPEPIPLPSRPIIQQDSEDIISSHLHIRHDPDEIIRPHPHPHQQQQLLQQQAAPPPLPPPPATRTAYAQHRYGNHTSVDSIIDNDNSVTAVSGAAVLPSAAAQITLPDISLGQLPSVTSLRTAAARYTNQEEDNNNNNNSNNHMDNNNNGDDVIVIEEEDYGHARALHDNNNDGSGYEPTATNNNNNNRHISSGSGNSSRDALSNHYRHAGGPRHHSSGDRHETDSSHRDMKLPTPPPSPTTLSLQQSTGLLLWHLFGSTPILLMATIVAMCATAFTTYVFVIADFGGEALRGVYIIIVVTCAYVLLTLLHRCSAAYEAAYYHKYCHSFTQTRKQLLESLEGSRFLNVSSFCVGAACAALAIWVVTRLERPDGMYVGLASLLWVASLLPVALLWRMRTIAQSFEPRLPAVDIGAFTPICHEYPPLIWCC